MQGRHDQVAPYAAEGAAVRQLSRQCRQLALSVLTIGSDEPASPDLWVRLTDGVTSCMKGVLFGQ